MSDAKFINDPIPNKTGVVVGTRPGIIKMSPIIAELNDRNVESFTIHAGQHYSYELDGKMFEDLGLEPPAHRVEDIDQTEYHGEQTAAMLTGIEKALLEEQPENVLVCADANFNLAGALAARKLRLTLGHVEAGLRSNDWRMPEEHNRIMIDHISDYLFVPTERAKQNALEDNVKGEVVVTGNTIVDAVQRNVSLAREQSTIHETLDISDQSYAVFTAHREENVDDPETLANLITIIERVIEEQELRIVYPLHPRTEKRLEQFGHKARIESIDGLELTESLGYLDFLSLLSAAELVLSDSGGVQEETCILGVPCVTLRKNTERPETVEVGSNEVAGTDPETALEAVEMMRYRESDWENPFGNGTAAQQIVNTILANS